MAIIPTSRGNPQASDVAVETVLPMTGNSSREDLQSTLAQNDAEVSKLYEDRNVKLTQGGIIGYNLAGDTVSPSENLILEINSKVAGGTPTLISIGSGPFTVSASGRMVYAVIDRIGATAVVTDDATSLPAVNSSNQEVFMIGKRDDAGDGTMRFFFWDNTALDAGQSVRLGATPNASSINRPYWSGYQAGLWETNSGTFVDPTVVSSPNTLTTILSNLLTVTAAASDLPGITFTPDSTTAVYEIKASFRMGGGGANSTPACRLTDGTFVVDYSDSQLAIAGTNLFPNTLNGFYFPGVITPVTLKIQLAFPSGSGNVAIENASSLPRGTIEWYIIKIN